MVPLEASELCHVACVVYRILHGSLTLYVTITELGIRIMLEQVIDVGKLLRSFPKLYFHHMPRNLPGPPTYFRMPQ